MGTKTRKPARNSKAKVVAVRPFDIRQHVTRQLYAASIDSLNQLVSAEPGAIHRSLAAEVLQPCSAAISRFTFTPHDLPVFLAALESIERQLAMHEQADANSAEINAVAKSIAEMRAFLCQGTLEFDANEALIGKLADRAILKADLEQRLPAEVVVEVKLVREALRLVEATQDEKALQSLSEIGFRSVMAPWRMLIRGMSQFYAGRLERAVETWLRLPTGRVPRGVAVAMLATIGKRLGDDPLPDSRRLSSITGGKCSRDEDVRRDLGNWFNDGALEEISIRISRWLKDGSVDAAWLYALRDRVYAELLNVSDTSLVRDVVHYLPAPAWDPKFQLPLAIAKMLSSSTAGLQLADIEKYFAVLDCNQELYEVDRRAIRACAMLQVAYLLTQLLNMFSGKTGKYEEAENKRIEWGSLCGQEFAKLIRDCIVLWPQWDAPYDLLANLPDDEFLPPAVVAEIHLVRVRERVDNVRVIKSAAKYFVRQGDVRQAEPLVQRLVSMAPRDVEAQTLSWNLSMLAFKVELAAHRVDQATAVIERMATHLPPHLPAGMISLMRAAICFLVEDTSGVQSYLCDAHANGVTPLAATFLMELHLTRADLPAKLKKPFRDERAKLLKSPTLTDARSACRLVGHVVCEAFEHYVGKVGHRNDLITYVKRAINKARAIDWDVASANEIGEFVVLVNDAVLRRQFINARGIDLPIRRLIQAIEAPQRAGYLLSNMLDCDPNDPERLPESLRPFAQALLQHSRQYRDDDDDDDDDGDWNDAEDWSDDDEPLFGGAMAMPSVDEIIRTIPRDLLEAFKQDPKAVEKAMRLMMPAQIVELVLPALRKM